VANDADCEERSVRRATDALRGLGLLRWQRRIVRSGWRVEQISNAYELLPAADILSVEFGILRFKTPSSLRSAAPKAAHQQMPATPEEQHAAQTALTAIRERRMAMLRLR
jgi:hypothetical protein